MKPFSAIRLLLAGSVLAGAAAQPLAIVVFEPPIRIVRAYRKEQGSPPK